MRPDVAKRRRWPLLHPHSGNRHNSGCGRAGIGGLGGSIASKLAAQVAGFFMRGRIGAGLLP
jgi:hypothetical protein